jgi:hypothetical protein
LTHFTSWISVLIKNSSLINGRLIYTSTFKTSIISKAIEQGFLVRRSFVEEGYDDVFIDADGIERYELVELPSEGGGTILPTFGIIVEF